MIPTLLYGVEQLGILHPQIHLERVWKFLDVFSYKISSKLETNVIYPFTRGWRPIEIMAMERVVEHMLEVWKSPVHQLHRSTRNASKDIQKTIYENNGMKDGMRQNWIQSFFTIPMHYDKKKMWRLTHHIYHEALFTYYITYIVPTDKNIFLGWIVNQQALIHIRAYPISIIASIWLSSHSHWHETPSRGYKKQD